MKSFICKTVKESNCVTDLNGENEFLTEKFEATSAAADQFTSV